MASLSPQINRWPVLIIEHLHISRKQKRSLSENIMIFILFGEYSISHFGMWLRNVAFSSICSKVDGHA